MSRYRMGLECPLSPASGPSSRPDGLSSSCAYDALMCPPTRPASTYCGDCNTLPRNYQDRHPFLGDRVHEGVEGEQTVSQGQLSLSLRNTLEAGPSSCWVTSWWWTSAYSRGRAKDWVKNGSHEEHQDSPFCFSVSLWMVRSRMRWPLAPQKGSIECRALLASILLPVAQRHRQIRAAATTPSKAWYSRTQQTIAPATCGIAHLPAQAGELVVATRGSPCLYHKLPAMLSQDVGTQQQQDNDYKAQDDSHFHDSTYSCNVMIRGFCHPTGPPSRTVTTSLTSMGPMP